jgi:hypothetical protein
MAFQFPDPPALPCNHNATLSPIIRCVEGVWVGGWIAVGEIDSLTAARVAAPLKPCGGSAPTNSFDVIAHAVREGWTPEAVADLVKSLK